MRNSSKGESLFCNWTHYLCGNECFGLSVTFCCINVCPSTSRSSMALTWDCDIGADGGGIAVKHKAGPEVIKLFPCLAQLSMKF